MSFQEKITNLFKNKKILFNEPLKKYTSFKVGGNADFIIFPEDKNDIINAINIANEFNINYFVMGNGSNLIFSDNGFRGIIINISNNMKKTILLDDNKIYTQAGILLSELSKVALKNNLKGLEFASGIPGTLGGAIFMNAGAYDGEMKDVILSSELIDISSNKIVTLNNKELDFKYRSSIIQSKPYIILSAVLKLSSGKQEEILKIMKELNNKRRDKQPLEYPSAGSTFKRPEGHFAGKLIMDAGLKGKRIGGAMVSPKHCGFIINYDNATSEDIINLIKYVQDVVFLQFGVRLSPEVRIIGEQKE